jgi:hypothetical protein
MRAARRFRSLIATLAIPLAGCVEVTGPAAVIVDDACNARFVSLGSSVTGSLTAYDCVTADGTESYVDFYELHVTASTWVDLYLESYDFDAYLMLFDEWDELIVEDDDSGESTDAWLTVKLPPGRYYIAATSFDAEEEGRYTLFVDPASALRADEAPNAVDATSIVSGLRADSARGSEARSALKRTKP